MINDHLGCFNVYGVLVEPLGQIAIGLAADLEQQILDVVELVIVA